MDVSAREQARLSRARADALRHFAALRRNPPEWYRWAVGGQPAMTNDEYDTVKAGRRKSTAPK